MGSAKTPSIIYLDDKTYKVIDVKRGGMGRVWLLENVFPDGSFAAIYKDFLAVKTFDFTPQHFAIGQELNNWVALNHKNILPLLKIGHLNYQTAAIMPWRRLGTLEDIFSDFNRQTEEKVIKIAYQIAEGLQYAYQTLRLVHLDLKPSNVLLLGKDPIEVQISDWGISRVAAKITQANWANKETTNQYTAYGAGTPLYMSPERFSANWVITPHADMYSLGMMLIQLLVGNLPFYIDEKNPYVEILRGTYIDNACQMLNVTSKRLRDLILDCISPHVNKRPATYSELISKIKRC